MSDSLIQVHRLPADVAGMVPLEDSPMSELVDRVAMEVAREFYGGCGESGGTGLCDYDLARCLCRRVARAAIGAMREPTVKMRQAASKAMSPGKRPTAEWMSNGEKHATRFRAMIDAALAE
jgi:hypothetical protein